MMTPLISGIDLGSCHIRVVVAEVAEDGTITVTGRGETPTPHSAVYMGNISNHEKYRGALRKVVEEVELMAGYEIGRSFVGISSPQFTSINSQGKTHIQGRNRKVTKEDKERVLEKCSSVTLPDSHEIFAILPVEYMIDGQRGIIEPIDMVGHDLSVKAHILICPRGLTSNVEAICNGIGIEVHSLVFEPLGALETVTTPDEQEMGVLLIDIGSDTTHVVLRKNNAILYSRVIKVGGRHFTTDLAQVLGISQREAETIKTTRATLVKESIPEDEALELNTVGQGRTRVETLANICEIIHDRAEELLEIIRTDLVKQSLELEFKGGMVMVGGGCKLDGLCELAERTFNVPVRPGNPRGFMGFSGLIDKPEWATAMGILLWGNSYSKNSGRRRGGMFRRLTDIILKRR